MYKPIITEDMIMTQKITLSIPDLLHEKLEEWRASFNLSKMFQEALTDAIHKKEEFQKRFAEDFDISDVVKRLKQEKFDWETNFYKKGKKEGIKWAKTAHYKDLLYVLGINDTYQLISDPVLNTYFENLYASSELQIYADCESVDHEQRFMQGWLDGVCDLWDQVKEKL
jgi:hypothetical protein